MKRGILIFSTVLMFVLSSAALFAEVATVEYVEGWVDLRYPDGELVEAFIGDALNRDDAIVTGDDGIATLGNNGAVEITVKPNSVFSLREIDSGGEKETVMHTALGAVSFKFNRLLGKEPRISTPSSVAGVRGTEFTVYAGDEGSTLFTVDSGEVQVVSQGVPVTLYEGEGVEVKAGRAPGAKFQKKGRPIDFSEWAVAKQEEFSADPIAGLRGIQRQMEDYAREVENLSMILKDTKDHIMELRQQYENISGEKGKEIADKFYDESVKPVEREISPLVQNIRYFTLSAFSLKRFVVTKQYMLMKAGFLTKKIDASTYSEFIDYMSMIESAFDQNILEYVTEYDI